MTSRRRFLAVSAGALLLPAFARAAATSACDSLALPASNTSRAGSSPIATSRESLFAPAGRVNDKCNRVHWTDGWDGYPAARAPVLESIAVRKPANPLVISGDVHATYLTDLHADPARPDSPRIATLCTGVVTAGRAGIERQ